MEVHLCTYIEDIERDEKRRDEREVMGGKEMRGKERHDRTECSRLGRRIEQRRVERRRIEQSRAERSSGRDTVGPVSVRAEALLAGQLLLTDCQSLSVSTRYRCLSGLSGCPSWGIGRMGSCGASEDGVGWGERGENGMGSNGVGTGLDIHTPLYHSDLTSHAAIHHTTSHRHRHRDHHHHHRHCDRTILCQCHVMSCHVMLLCAAHDMI